MRRSEVPSTLWSDIPPCVEFQREAIVPSVVGSAVGFAVGMLVGGLACRGLCTAGDTVEQFFGGGWLGALVATPVGGTLGYFAGDFSGSDSPNCAANNE